MSLKQFLVEADRLNYQRKTGAIDTQMDGGDTKNKKRKLADVAMDDGGESIAVAASKRRKVTTDGFLDCGSVSWSLLLAIFFLSLHKGGEFVVEDEEKFSMTYQSCLEMLEVLSHEFGDMIPLETSPHVLEASVPGALAKLRENSLI